MRNTLDVLAPVIDRCQAYGPLGPQDRNALEDELRKQFFCPASSPGEQRRRLTALAALALYGLRLLPEENDE